jgi:hypothetical protein
VSTTAKHIIWICANTYMFIGVSYLCYHAFCIPQFLLEARKVKLLSELQTIYPIERLDNGEYAIRGVELPADHK